MTLTQRFSKLFGRQTPPAPVRALAMIGAAAGLCGLFAAAVPASHAAPVELMGGVGALSLCASLVLWLVGARMPPRGLQVAVAIMTLGTSVLVSRAATDMGTVVTACAYLWIGVYAAFFFSRRAARAQMALIAVTFGAALLISDNGVPIVAWVFMTASLFIAGETIGWQSTLLRREAHTDSLTGLLNRKGLALAAERAFSLADRAEIPLTAALIDLDGFKQINDRDGHLAGDRLLVELTRAWSAELEPSDIFARLGGDEFLLLLVGSGGEESARMLERLRFVSPIPWSAGVITREPGEDLSACLGRADSALYGVKRQRSAHRDLRRLSAVQSLQPRASGSEL